MKQTRTDFPLVTAFCSCYNHARFVVEALESIRIQDYPNLELIVWDDVSTDGSQEIIQRWLTQHWPGAIFLRHHTNLGVCQSLNEMLRHAKGKYLAGISADDVWLPGRLIHQVEEMERLSGDFGVLYTDAYQIDEDGTLLPMMFIEAHRQFDSPPQGLIHTRLMEGNWIPGMTVLMRRDSVLAIGGYNEKLFYEDWDFWIRMARQFRFVYSPKPAAKYRHVSTSTVRTRQREMRRATSDMFAGYLKHGSLTPYERRSAIIHLMSCAVSAYEAAEKEQIAYATRLIRFYPRLITFLMLACMLLGVPYGYYARMASCGAACKHAARRLIRFAPKTR